MWRILEHRILEHHGIGRSARKLPPQVLKKYELWKDIVFRYGPGKLREFTGFHDEALKGDRTGQRSSRLSRQYRVIYAVEREVVTVYVLEIIPHDC